MSVLFRMLMMSAGGGVNGLDLLNASDAWVDADDSTVTTVDISGPMDLRASPDATINVTTANIEGPDGELGVELQEGTATGIRLIRWDPPANWSYGYTRVRYRYRATEDVGEMRWPFYNQSPEPATFWAFAPSSKQDPEVVVSSLSTGKRRVYSQRYKYLADDWIDLEFESHLYGASGDIYGAGMRTGSYTGTDAAPIQLASAEFIQRRVSAVSDVRDATERFADATNETRQCLAEDLWLGESACFVEAWNNGDAGQTPMVDAASTPSAVALVVHVHYPRPATAGTVLRVGNIEVQAGTDGHWHIVQGGNDEDTGAFVASVPVCVALRVAGGTATLYIDGQSVGSASYTQGGTGLQVGGSSAEVVWKSLAFKTGGWSAAEVAAVSSVLRSRAGLPETWPVVVGSGQSNMTHSATHNRLGSAHDSNLRKAPGWAYKAVPYDGSVNPWVNAIPLDYQTESSNHFGVLTGWLMRAQQDGVPCAVIECGRGGAAATQWQEGGDMRAYCETQIDAALAEFGTHLVAVTKWLWVQGEAETESETGSANYQSTLEDVHAWVKDRWGADIQWVGLRLNEFVEGTYGDDVRAEQDAFAAAHSDVVYAKPPNTPDMFGDAVHYWWWRKHELGELLYDAAESSFSPADLGDMLVDVDFDFVVTDVGVATALDRLETYDAGQAADAAQPAWQQFWRNGHSAAVGGAADVLQVAGLSGAQPYTEYFIGEWTESTGNNEYLQDTLTTRSIVGQNAGAPGFYMGSTWVTGAAPERGAAFIARFVANGADSELYVEFEGGTVLTISGDGGTAALEATLYLMGRGGSNSWLGKLARWLVYMGDKSAADEALWSYLRTRYEMPTP